MGQQKIRWGILGTASIAKRSVIPGIRDSRTGIVTAIASRDIHNATEAAKELNIPQAYGSYEQLLHDPDIDAVYIPLPNHLHKEWTIRAVRAGKHVLCEKPLALNAEEAREMAAAAESAGVRLAEAFMYRHHPRYVQIKEMIRSGAIGDIRGIHGTFTFNNAAAESNVRFYREMGGGALYDVGCYPISAARMLLDEEPEAVTCHAMFSPRHDHVDMMMAGLVEFPHHIALTFDCGMWAAFRNTLQILGTDGLIDVPSAFIAQQDASANFFVTDSEGRREIEVPHVNHYALQADDLGDSIHKGTPLAYNAWDSVKNMAVIDACLQSAQTRSRVAVKEVESE